MGGVLVGYLALVILLACPPPSGGDPSLHIDRMEKARILMEAWGDWSVQTEWKWTSGPNLREVGAPCKVTPEETLKHLYYLRFSLNLKEENEGADWDRKYYVFITHVARSLNFYEKKMGVPPVYEPRHFCQNPHPYPDLPKDGKSKTFRWPPNPYPLVCQDEKCVHCAHAENSAIKEACNLIEPPEESLESPSEAQLLYEDLKDSLHSNFPERRERKAREVRREGKPCSAPPWKSLVYVTVFKSFPFSPSDPVTIDEYANEWRGIQKISTDVDRYRRIFKGFVGKDLHEVVYCQFDLNENRFRRGWDEEGGLVCAGATCKPCKLRPREKGVQRWNFEQGPLYEACKEVTQLEVGLPSRDDGDSCPEVGPPTVCDPNYGKGFSAKDPCEDGGGGGTEPDGNVGRETNFQRWLKSNVAHPSRFPQGILRFLPFVILLFKVVYSLVL